jgi:hypothetical protein
MATSKTMYKIGKAWEPGEFEETTDYWTLDIDYEKEEKDALRSHGAAIQIHGTSLSICLLKAKFICEMLNEDVFHGCEVFVDLLEMAKMIEAQQVEFKIIDEV